MNKWKKWNMTVKSCLEEALIIKNKVREEVKTTIDYFFETFS